MDYLLYSPSGISAFLVPRLGKDKDVEKVYFCCPDKEQSNLLKDMEQVKEWKKLVRCSDPFTVLNHHGTDDLTVLIDDVGVGMFADHLRTMGYKVIGGSEVTDNMENDREFGTQLMKKIMNVPNTTEFTSFEKGITWLKSKEKEERFVFKPNNCDVPKEYTYVAQDVPDLIAAMKDFQTKWQWDTTFQLQTFIKGTECDAMMWFDGENYIPELSYYFENKKVLTGDLGVAGGGEVAAQLTREPQGPYWEIYKKLKPVLKKAGYVGQMSINTMVSEEDKQPYFLEVTARFGYPSLPLDVTMLEDNGHTMHEFFQMLVNKKPKAMYPHDKISTVLVVSTPPYPHGEHNGIAKGLPIATDPQWDEYYFPFGVMYDTDHKRMILASGDGYALNVTCCDNTLDGAVAMTYDTYVPGITMRHKQYRTDLGVDAKKRIKKIKEYGLLE